MKQAKLNILSTLYLQQLVEKKKKTTEVGASPPTKVNTVHASRMVVVPAIRRPRERQGLVSDPEWAGENLVHQNN